jgi:nitroreductase
MFESEEKTNMSLTDAVAVSPPARTPAHEVLPIFTARWSSRAMSGEPVAEAELMRLFEAARWAPSGSNSQPWRFVYAQAGTEEYQTLLELLFPGNRLWSERASALVVITSQGRMPDGRPHPSHAFDAGAAWMSLALQGSAMGLVVHAMGGFDRERAPQAIGLPPGYEIHCVVAVGKPGDPAALPEQLRAREQPSARLPVEQLAFAGRFPG